MADAVIGYVHPGVVRAEFCASVLATCMEGATRIRSVIALESGPNISRARNMIVRSFLEDNLAPWLFMCDTDMWFQPDTVTRLIAAGKPVTGALCWCLDGGERYPTMYDLVDAGEGRIAFRRPQTWPEDDVVEVTGTGAACLLMSRDALLKVEKTSGDDAAPWFRESPAGPMTLMGEDLTFCLRCQAAEIPVHVHTGVKAGHMKTQMLI